MDIIKQQRRKTIMAPKNPYDVATIFSIYPRPIRDVKATIQPPVYELEPGTFEKPSSLLIKGASWWREIDPEQPLLEIPVSSIVIAESIVVDYCQGLLGATGGAKPGLFFVPGNVNVALLKTEYKGALEKARVNQNHWYRNLVALADGLWVNSKGHPSSINDDMRRAARELGLENKDWMQDHLAAEMIRCVACGALRNPNYPICGSCKNVVDKAKAKELGIELAS